MQLVGTCEMPGTGFDLRLSKALSILQRTSRQAQRDGQVLRKGIWI
jgi:hypothetical protein